MLGGGVRKNPFKSRLTTTQHLPHHRIPSHDTKIGDRVTLHNHKRIDGFDYEVSETGEVRSLTREVTRTNGRPYTVPAKVLKPVWNGRHWQVVLYRDRQKSRRYVHVLVLETFVGLRPEGMKGLHRDDDPHNNHISNLYWGTMQDNALDRVRNGRDHNARKTHCKRGHPLEQPNLAPSSAGRMCLSCNRANTLAQWRGVGADNEEYRQNLSDQKYQEILGSVL